MTLWTPDPTFYPSPRDAAAGPKETLAYVGAFDRAAIEREAHNMRLTGAQARHRRASSIVWRPIRRTSSRR